MSQNITDAKSVEPEPITNSYWVKILGVKMVDKGTSKKSKVYYSSDINDEPIMFLDPKPLKMIVPVDISIDKTMDDATKKKKKESKKNSTSLHDTVEIGNVDMNICSKSDCPRAEPTSKLVGKSPKSTDETYVKENPSVNHVMIDGHLVDTLVNDKIIDDVFNDILNEKHDNVEAEVQVHAEERRNKKPLPLTLDKKLFVGTHVPNIMAKHHGQTVSGSSSLVSKATRKDVLYELMEVSKALQVTITSSTIRKRSVDGLIKMLNKENDVKDEDEDDNEEEEEEKSASDEEDDSSES
ncbi:hypothetical protein KIW84_061286 [Lathyrus oleraceus]|uniref:Envelope-like protein n=1 Tax=Pisum sativum TaxID=3888 RepID=A0A9D4W218_PEA|nr:hypothetical protein KIW84_061286 [Pisum sativum]